MAFTSDWNAEWRPSSDADRAVGLELDQMQGELVRPAERAPIDLHLVGAGHLFEELVGNRPHREALGVDDHVLDLDAEAFEQSENVDAHRLSR